MENREAFIVTKGKQFVDIDHSSGGYPYFVADVFRSKFFTTSDEAFSYAKKFDNLVVKKVNIEISNYFSGIKE